jgi:prepilin-type processing-associated H-X9-DG protein
LRNTRTIGVLSAWSETSACHKEAAPFCKITPRIFILPENANVVFCDGHVESPTLKFLFADTSDAALARWNRGHLPRREKLSRDFSGQF